MIQYISRYGGSIQRHLEIISTTIMPDTLANAKRVLAFFDRFLATTDTDTITEHVIAQWISEMQKNLAPKTVSDHVSYLRSFLRYLQYEGVPVFFPDCPKCGDEYVPYIFSSEEINAIVMAADTMPETHRSNAMQRIDMEFSMLLRMLIGCGFRLSEPLSAKVGDVNFNNGTILIRHAKNNKQRLVPMDMTLTAMLEKYCISLGIRAYPECYLFPSKIAGKNTLSMSTCADRFRKILILTGIYSPGKPHSRGQCLHCLRHYFAIHSFAQGEKGGRSASHSVPFLSVYLGHHDMDETEKYLKFSSDIFPEYGEMFEQFADGLFAEVENEE